jgi:uncharacterized protein YndB with AHSA1/START domain
LRGGDVLGRIEKSIEIKAPPEKVWEMLALDRLPEWNEEYGNVKYTSDVRNSEDKYRVGASSHTNMKGAGAIDFEITESLKNEKVTFRMIGKRANNTVVTYVLESVDDGTNFVYVMTYELPWGILGKGLGRLAKGSLEKEGEKSLEKLKTILEK